MNNEDGGQFRGKVGSESRFPMSLLALDLGVAIDQRNHAATPAHNLSLFGVNNSEVLNEMELPSSRNFTKQFIV